jgi:alkaline phosphatase D
MKESDRQGLRAMWHEQWINPDSDPKKEGIYFSTRLGSVEIFMLDTRSCRVNDQRGQYGCYLGLEQQEWLKEGATQLHRFIQDREFGNDVERLRQ